MYGYRLVIKKSCINNGVLNNNMPTWTLEIQRFDATILAPTCEVGGKFVHIGYVKKQFLNKKAAEHYNALNPHMRALNAHGTWKSD